MLDGLEDNLSKFLELCPCQFVMTEESGSASLGFGPYWVSDCYIGFSNRGTFPILELRETKVWRL